MNTVAQTLASLKLGDAVHHRNLAVFPLYAPSDASPDYLTLDEALATGLARVTEVSEAGRVPELLFENAADRSVLLVDGEELIGARQNRILNLSVLVGAKSSVVIPVSCVESGRWRYESRNFRSGHVHMYAEARAEKTQDVSRSLRESGSRRGDQGRVWDNIERKQRSMNVDSSTSSMHDIYEQRQGDLARYQSAFDAKAGQVGAVFAINRRVRGLELFDAASTFAKFMQKILGSYALDAVSGIGGASAVSAAVPPASAAQAFVDRLQQASLQTFKALAQGEDLRLGQGDVSGGALVVGDRVVHLAAFAVEARPGVSDGFRRASGW